MSLARHIAALMESLIPDDLDALPPAERRRFADACRHVAKLAERQPQPEYRWSTWFT